MVPLGTTYENRFCLPFEMKLCLFAGHTLVPLTAPRLPGLAGVATNTSQGGIQPLSLQPTELLDRILPALSSQEILATNAWKQMTPVVERSFGSPQ